MLFLIFSFFLLTGCGTNPVTGKKELRILSEKQEIDMGRKNYLASQKTQGGRLQGQTALEQYVQKIGKKLAAISDRPHLPYEFVILNDSVPNAWAMPGGKIAINKGLLLGLENEAELAAVLGHEIVHSAAGHSARSVEKANILNAGLSLLSHSLGNHQNADGIMQASSTAAQLGVMAYSRHHEKEADQYGMLYMSRAGYDPKAAVSLQEKFLAWSKSSGTKKHWIAGFFASHPPSEERIVLNKKHLEKLPSGGKIGSAEYQAMIASLKKTRQKNSK
ncbi:MAG: M48 family metalloprotease [Gammaproteobacteria bacterium]